MKVMFIERANPVTPCAMTAMIDFAMNGCFYFELIIV
jgi:hypothetical protein